MGIFSNSRIESLKFPESIRDSTFLFKVGCFHLASYKNHREIDYSYSPNVLKVKQGKIGNVIVILGTKYGKFQTEDHTKGGRNIKNARYI